MKKSRLFFLLSAMTIAVATVIFFTQKTKTTQPTEYVFTARAESTDSK